MVVGHDHPNGPTVQRRDPRRRNIGTASDDEQRCGSNRCSHHPTKNDQRSMSAEDHVESLRFDLMTAESLHVDWWSSTSAPPGSNAAGSTDAGFTDAGSTGSITMLHGFAQTGRCWGPLAEALRVQRDVRCVDLPGHGGSGDVVADVADTATLVTVQSAASSAHARSNVLLGYSLGARVALTAASQQAGRAGSGDTASAGRQLFDALVLISGSPGLQTSDERVARRRSDDALADRIESIGTAAFIDEWLSGPLFKHLDVHAQHRSERLRNEPRGLATSLRMAGTGTMDPLWDELASIEIPVLVMAGADDPKFASIAVDMAVRLPRARLAIINDAGHTAHLEQSDVALAHIVEFLAALD